METLHTDTLQSLLPKVCDIATQAGEKIKAIYEIYRVSNKLDKRQKSDHSPVTEADIISHEFIIQVLDTLDLRFPILSEESADISFSERQAWQTYWLIDPLDGTREFINHSDDFTVNIALIHEHKSVLGVVYIPMDGSCYSATAGSAAYRYSKDGSKQQLLARKQLGDKPVVAISYSHAGGETKDFLDKLGPHIILRRGSMVKCCMIAEGKADIYPRMGNTCEWDTAAGQCVLEQAGGSLTDLSGRSFRYNTKDSILNPSFVAYAPSIAHWQELLK